MTSTHGTVLRVDKYIGQALQQIVPIGDVGPVELECSRGAPHPHTTLALTIPQECIPGNAKTYADIMTGTNRHVDVNSAHIKLLGMLSMAVTRPRNGFGDLAEPGRDRRGTVIVGSPDLEFSHNGQTFPRTIQSVEEIVTPAGHPKGLRFWFFVLDPTFDIGQALVDVATSNARIYNDHEIRTARADQVLQDTINRRARYVCHASVRSESQLVDVINTVISHGSNSIDTRTNSDRVTTFSMIRSNIVGQRSIVGENASGITFKTLFSPATSLCFHERGVQRSQLTLSNYCHIADALVGGPDDDAAAASADDDDEIDRLIGLGDEMDIDAGADDEDPAMQARRQALAAGRHAMVGGVQLDRIDADSDNASADDDADAMASDPFNEQMIGCILGNLEMTFHGFPHPDRVQRIPTAYFGSYLLNVPIPGIYRIRGDRLKNAVNTHNMTFERLLKHLDTTTDEWEEKTDAERVRHIEAAYHAFVDAVYEPASPEYFLLVPSDLEFDDNEQRNAIELICKAKIDKDEDRIVMDRLPTVRAAIESEHELKFYLPHGDDTLNVDSDDDRTPGAERPLRETVSSESMTLSAIKKFAETNDFLRLRISNHESYHDMVIGLRPGTQEYYAAVKNWREQATDVFWEVAMSSDNLSEAFKKSRGWFRQLQPHRQWALHELTEIDLSYYANTMLLFIQRYNEVFLGATTQNLFTLIFRVVLGTAMYKWDLRPNLLIYGRGGDGKSFPLTAAQVLTAPGIVECYTHITAKAFATNNSYWGETMAMHEAPAHMLGIDERGQEVPSNPILKDRLIRQRVGTLSYGQDESGQRIRRNDEAMVMGNIILITNDCIPSDEKALTQRFIVVPVHKTERRGFRRGDYVSLSSDELETRFSNSHVHASRLFSFYVSLVFYMSKAWVIPDPSTEAASKLTRLILERFTKDTGLDSDDGRKRTKILDMMAITAVMNAVSVGLFSRLAEDFKYEEMPDGRRQYKEFHPRMIVEHVMPRLFVTDEIVVDNLTLLAFLYEPRAQYDVLCTIVHGMNGSVHDGEVVTCSDVHFRYVNNPKYRRNGASSSSYRSRQQQQQQRPNAGALQRSVNGQVLVGSVSGNQGTGADDTEEEPEFIIDRRYVTVEGNKLAQICTRIVSATQGSKPSEVEVSRVINTLCKMTRPSHPAMLVAEDDDDANSIDEDSEDSEDDEMIAEDMYEKESDSENFMIPAMSDHPDRNRRQHVGRAQAKHRPPAGFEAKQLNTYLNKHFRLRFDLDAAPTTEFIAFREADPKKRGQKSAWVLCVMVEALYDNTFMNGILKACTAVLSNNTQPREGKKYFTCIDYMHRVPSGAEECMPQYKRIVHIPRTERPMRFPHIRIGTMDSNAAILNGAECRDDVLTNRHTLLQNTLFTEMTADQSMNLYFCESHLRECDMSIENCIQYTPEWADQTIRERTLAYARSHPDKLTFISNYPVSCAEEEYDQRCVRDAFVNNPNCSDLAEFALSEGERQEMEYLSSLAVGLKGVHFDLRLRKIVALDPTSKAGDLLSKHIADYRRMRTESIRRDSALRAHGATMINDYNTGNTQASLTGDRNRYQTTVKARYRTIALQQQRQPVTSEIVIVPPLHRNSHARGKKRGRSKNDGSTKHSSKKSKSHHHDTPTRAISIISQ